MVESIGIWIKIHLNPLVEVRSLLLEVSPKNTMLSCLPSRSLPQQVEMLYLEYFGALPLRYHC
jgi:hypothetical protein